MQGWFRIARKSINSPKSDLKLTGGGRELKAYEGEP